MDTDIRDCFFDIRSGEPPIFRIRSKGGSAIRLRGYAIIPKEKYENLVKGYSSRKASSFDQV